MNNGVNMAAKKLLIVEDESILAMRLEECLIDMGFVVLAIANSGESAIQLASELRPDVVLMDIHLFGEIDGIEAAKRIWERLKTPVIFMTANSDEVTFRRAKSARYYGYLVKPFSMEKLGHTIVTALAGRFSESMVV